MKDEGWKAKRRKGASTMVRDRFRDRCPSEFTVLKILLRARARKLALNPCTRCPSLAFRRFRRFWRCRRPEHLLRHASGEGAGVGDVDLAGEDGFARALQRLGDVGAG